jgi:hypothetical protein
VTLKPLWIDDANAAVALFRRGEDGRPVVEFAHMTNHEGMPLTFAEMAHLTRELSDRLAVLAESMPDA